MTSIPASRRARAMILAPRSWPSSPTFATTTLIVRSIPPILTGRVCRARGEHRTPSRLSPAGTEVGDEEGDAGQEEEHPAEQADHVPGPYAGRHKERRGDDEEHPSQEVVPLVPARTIFGHAKLLSYKTVAVHPTIAPSVPAGALERSARYLLSSLTLSQST